MPLRAGVDCCTVTTGPAQHVVFTAGSGPVHSLGGALRLLLRHGEDPLHVRPGGGRQSQELPHLLSGRFLGAALQGVPLLLRTPVLTSSGSMLIIIKLVRFIESKYKK